MKQLANLLLGVAVFQIVSTLVGFVTLLTWPAGYAPWLDNTLFAGQYVLAALLLGVIVGGFQWVAAILQTRRSEWWLLGHLSAGIVMLGWIAGECLVLDSFIWPHAFWGGLGALQIALVCVHLGALQPQPTPGSRKASCIQPKP